MKCRRLLQCLQRRLQGAIERQILVRAIVETEATIDEFR